MLRGLKGIVSWKLPAGGYFYLAWPIRLLVRITGFHRASSIHPNKHRKTAGSSDFASRQEARISSNTRREIKIEAAKQGIEIMIGNDGYGKARGLELWGMGND